MAQSARLAPLHDPIVRHLRTDAATLRVDATVAEAMASLRRDPPGGRIIYFYAVDEEGRLAGVVPTRQLLLAGPERRVGEVMIERVVRLPDSATVMDACEFFAVHRFLALPVVDPDGRLLGVVDVDLYSEETAWLAESPGPPTDEEIFQLIGVHLAHARRGSALNAFRGRFPWLLCNVAGGLAAAWVTGLFEGVLERALALALFVPIVLALSESVAIQSVSLTVQWLHDAAIRSGMASASLRREAATGAILGVGCGALVGLIVALWQRQVVIAAAVSGTIAAALIAAALLGALVPIALHLLRVDPRVAAGPIALVAADLVTLLLYFGLAGAVV